MEYSHLTKGERNRIYEAKCNKKSLGIIAKELGRHKSTISREVRRNSDKVGYLYPHQADERTRERRYQATSTKIDRDPNLKDFIIKNLEERLSPKMIAALWCRKNPGKTISKEPIYNFVYSDEGIKRGLPKLLVRAKKKRGIVHKARKSKIKEAVSIHKRPQEINERKEVGHYEGDLIFNEGSMSQNVLTLIDRVTREAIMIFNESKHTAVVLGKFIKYIKENNIVIKSITFDNGSEFAEHTELNKLGIKTYFCDPGSPHQKGSIENFNGVSRRYLPFSMPASQITPEVVRETMIKVNNLPREILGWKSATEYARSINQEVFWS
jgi:IS30 family transposase